MWLKTLNRTRRAAAERVFMEFMMQPLHQTDQMPSPIEGFEAVRRKIIHQGMPSLRNITDEELLELIAEFPHPTFEPTPTEIAKSLESIRAHRIMDVIKQEAKTCAIAQATHAEAIATGDNELEAELDADDEEGYAEAP